MDKNDLVRKLQAAKESSGKSYDDIAQALGVCNAYAAQLFHAQAQLHPDTEKKLKKVVPGLDKATLKELRKPPFRSYDPDIIQEPTIYRLDEVVMHYGESIKELINEKFGDGIMSAIDFKLTVDKVKGSQGEDRVVITMNGKFLPHIEQKP